MHCSLVGTECATSGAERPDRTQRRMTRLEFLESLQALSLSVERFGEEFGISRRKAYRYASDETPVREPIAKLIAARLQQRTPSSDALCES